MPADDGERPAELPDIGVGPEVSGARDVAAAGDQHPGERLAQGDGDRRIALVVLEPDVEPGPILLDEVVLEDQRLRPRSARRSSRRRRSAAAAAGSWGWRRSRSRNSSAPGSAGAWPCRRTGPRRRHPSRGTPRGLREACPACVEATSGMRRIAHRISRADCPRHTRPATRRASGRPEAVVTPRYTRPNVQAEISPRSEAVAPAARSDARAKPLPRPNAAAAQSPGQVATNGSRRRPDSVAAGRRLSRANSTQAASPDARVSPAAPHRARAPEPAEARPRTGIRGAAMSATLISAKRSGVRVSCRA